MNTKPNAIRDRLDAVRQTSLDLYAGRRVNNVNLRASQHRNLALGKNRQVAELMRVLQDSRASRECGFFGVQPIAEVVRDHAVLCTITKGEYEIVSLPSQAELLAAAVVKTLHVPERAACPPGSEYPLLLATTF